MYFIALVSGGKDSIYSIMRCMQLGHECCCLANLHPPPAADCDECDSFTFQTVGCGAVELVAKAMQLPLVRVPLHGGCVRSTCEYDETEGDEVEDLLLLIQQCLKEHPRATAVSCGAVLSDYQRLRVENVCRRLKLTSLAPLWRVPQAHLVESMLADGIDAIVVKVTGNEARVRTRSPQFTRWPQVASAGLPLEFLGRRLSELHSKLALLAQQHALHVAGEGGECVPCASCR
jgi:diphthine-ammonia ligase